MTSQRPAPVPPREENTADSPPHADPGGINAAGLGPAQPADTDQPETGAGNRPPRRSRQQTKRTDMMQEDTLSSTESKTNPVRPSDDDVRNLAYRLWEEGGWVDGMQDEYWYAAERQLMSGQMTPAAPADPHPSDEDRSNVYNSSPGGDTIAQSPMGNDKDDPGEPNKGRFTQA